MNTNPVELKLPKRFWNQILIIGSQIGFFVATGQFVLASISSPDNVRSQLTLITILYAASFLAFLSGQLLTQYGYKKLKKSIQLWAEKKYGVEFDNNELNTLVKPLYGHQFSKNFQSNAVRQWYQVDNGRKELATFSIVVVDNEPILYRQELAGEVPSEEERQRQQIIAVFAEEIGGNEYVFLHNPNNDAEPQEGITTLLWSDPLRVELYMNKEQDKEDKAVFSLPLEVFFERWVPTALARNVQVGINWDENNFKFDTKTIFNS